jgi:hypothetical protein
MKQLNSHLSTIFEMFNADIKTIAENADQTTATNLEKKHAC